MALLVTMIDMIGFGIIIPFLTYLFKTSLLSKAWFSWSLGGPVDDGLFVGSIHFLTFGGRFLTESGDVGF